MPQHPFTVAELAVLAGVSARRLQETFQQYVGMAPLAYLADVRLTRIHDELRLGKAGAVNVSEVAQRGGFGHLGRFANRYRARFGELPLQTLRSA
ncbi:helix-turn-helix transcriptional regulator [Streptomyces sp. MAI_2237]